MPRKGPTPKREVLPDPKYGSRMADPRISVQFANALNQ